jgi:peptidoglycan hydrolase-like protein with peptidoglycan-binding domain
MKWVLGLSSLLMLVCAEAPAWAATITVIPTQTRPFVTIRGELKLNDEDVFAEKVLRLKDAVVVLNSPGGNLIAGIEIGRAIRLKGFDTVVLDGTVCASACGLAWLGGRTLFAGPKAQIGFHAAWVMEGGQKREKGPGNALVGAYLHSLGLRDEAIVYLTMASPDDAKWLNFKDAHQLGILVKEVASSDEPSKQVARKPDGPSIQQDKPAVPDAVYLDADVSSEPTPVPPALTVASPDARTAALPQEQVTSPIWRPEPPKLEPQVLNLVDLDAAVQVQRRLQERGYFVGLVDGVWGPRSRIALRDFKAANGLGADDGWDLRVQLALFDDRSRVAAANYVPPDPQTTTDGLFRPFQVPSGAKLHPLNPRDARKIQSHLLELGYYRKPGDGIWGLASRYALRDFKAANGLSADDMWDSSVEALIENGRSLHAAETPFGEWAMVGTSCSDATNPQRLSISAKEISARNAICRLEHSLARSGDTWFGTASCLSNQQETAFRVSMVIVQGRLVDQSTTVAAPKAESRVPVYERCQ